jgi:hypothetical protein
MTTIKDNEISVICERLAWADYAAPRFRPAVTSNAPCIICCARVQSAFDRMRAGAARTLGGGLDFGHARLAVQVLAALEKPCEYCGALFGIKEFGGVYALPPEGRNGKPAARGLANVRVPCATCCAAKALSGTEWRDVMAALRTADTEAASGVLAALARGYQQRGSGGGAKGTSPHPGGRQ